MAQVYPDDADLAAMAGDDILNEIPIPEVGTQDWYLQAIKYLWRLATNIFAAGGLEVYKDGDLTFGVRAGRYMNGDTAVNYAGAAAQALTNNATNYIYLTAAGVLTVNTTGLPDPSTTPHLPLATIVTAAGVYDGRQAVDGGDVVDYRGRAIFRALSALTAANANTLAGYLSTGIPRSALAAESLKEYPVPLLTCRDSAGLSMSDSIDAGNFYIYFLGWGNGQVELAGTDAQSNTQTDTGAQEVALPPEYVAAGALNLIINAHYGGTGTPGTKTIDAEVYKLDTDGEPGADLCATAIQTLTAAAADYEFTITAAALSPGDKLIVLFRAVIQETGGANPLTAYINSIRMKMDVKG